MSWIRKVVRRRGRRRREQNDSLIKSTAYHRSSRRLACVSSPCGEITFTSAVASITGDAIETKSGNCEARLIVAATDSPERNHYVEGDIVGAELESPCNDEWCRPWQMTQRLVHLKQADGSCRGSWSITDAVKQTPCVVVANHWCTPDTIRYNLMNCCACIAILIPILDAFRSVNSVSDAKFPSLQRFNVHLAHDRSNTLREGYDLAWQLRFSSEGFNPAEDSVVNLLNRTKRASWVSIRLCLLLYHSVVTFYAYYKLLPIKWTSIISGNVSLLKPSFQQWNVLTSDSPTLQRSKDTNRSISFLRVSFIT